ncbi:CbiQ family ECF transporter T component [Mesorhizobium newzealandense]|uniref:CbiQ family ECF transporter T component n=1 Tax=Mesorhizobium newzealandense TaxID=1300302 RepID=A0ABW4UI91_9HYPH
MFISAFKRAEDLAIAMEARGYQSGEDVLNLGNYAGKQRYSKRLSAYFV